MSRIGDFLREAALQLHRHKMWLNTNEEDPEVFQNVARTVCKTYLESAQIEKKQGTHTVSIDEMTGIPALEQIAADQDIKPDQFARQESEYERHGTTTIIGKPSQWASPCLSDPDRASQNCQTSKLKNWPA